MQGADRRDGRHCHRDYASLALKSDGTVVAWGCESLPPPTPCQVPPGLTGVAAIAAGRAHCLALKRAARFVSWGCQAWLEYARCAGPQRLRHVTSLAAGAFQSLALRSNGMVMAWGCD